MSSLSLSLPLKALDRAFRDSTFIAVEVTDFKWLHIHRVCLVKFATE